MKILIKPLLLCFFFLPILAAGAPSPAPEADDGFLIVEVWLGQQRISQDANILYRNGKVYLPAEFLINVLKLPLSVNKSNEVVGWIYKKSNTVKLAPSNKTASVNGNSYVMGPADAVKLEKEWYYSSDFIGHIFDLTFVFNYSRQAIAVHSGKELLPGESLQQKQARQREFDLQQQLENPPLESGSDILRDPSFTQLPFLDVAARYMFNKQEGQPSDRFLGYSANAFAVTGGFDTEAYVYDMNKGSPATIALKTSRYQEDGKMLGLFKTVEIGDIFSFSNPAVNYSQNGRGFKLSTSRDENAESKTFNIRDILPLGWDVELYRDSELLGYQGTNNNGFFEFRDIPLLLGNNRFKLVFYGPQGQQREQIINYLFMGGLINQGQTSIQLGFVEKNKYIIETRKHVPSYSEGYNGLFAAAYGLTDTLTANVSAIYDSVPVLENTGFERRDKFYASAGLAYLWLGMYFNLQSVYDPKEKAASADAYWQTNWDGWDITLQNIYYGNVLTERNVLMDGRIQNDSIARVNKTLDFGRGLELPFNYAFRYFTTNNHQYQTEHTLGLYKTVFRNLYTSFSYQNVTGLSGGDLNLLHMDVNQSHNGFSLRGYASYDFLHSHIRAVGTSLYQDITNRLNVGLHYDHVSMSDVSSLYSNQYGGSLNWKTPFGYWSLDTGWSDTKSYYAYLGFNMSFSFDKFNNKLHTSPDKLYGFGALSADVFMDDNQNGKYDKNEARLSDAAVTLTPTVTYPEQTIADEEGNAFVSQLRGYKTYTADVNVNKLDASSALISSAGPQRFAVRPGQVIHLNFPVLGTGDIEGTVYLTADNRRQNGMRGVSLQLTNIKTGKVVGRKISEFDGYFLFEGLPMGTYRLEVDPRQSKDLGLLTPPPSLLVIKKMEDIKRKDIDVSYADAKRTSTPLHTISSLQGAVLRGTEKAKVVFKK